MKSLDFLEPYLQLFLDHAPHVYHHPYFQIGAVVLTVVLSLLLGRLTHEKKLTSLLDMVNDADTTRKRISDKLTSTNQSLKDIQNKKKIITGVTLVLLLANAAMFYFTQKIDLKFIGGSATVLVAIWGLYLGRLKYLSWAKKRLEEGLRRTSMAAEAELKQILQLLGEGVTAKMKAIFERDLEEQWSKESKEECRLAKCTNEKAAYQELFNLYEQIINEIKQINLCDICLGQENISVQKLGMPEFEAMLKNCRKAVAGSLPLEQKK